MNDKARILQAHVQFELNRFNGVLLEEMVEQEVAALFAWLQSVKLVEVVTPRQVDGWIQRFVCEMPLSEELVRTIDQSVRVAYEALRQAETRRGELLPRQNYDQFVETIVGMKEIRGKVTAWITTSSIYSRLVSHVLYYGIKSYLLTENVFARKVPGVSSLLRLGQNALSSAAPKLEAGIDSRLAAFLDANIQETIHESKRYLDSVLDDPMVWTVAEEIWAANAGETVAAATHLVDGSSLDDVVVSGRNVWLHFRRTPFFHHMAELLVQEFFRAHGEKTVGVLLADLGVTQEMVVQEVGAVAVPIAEKARQSGYLEARIRSRLDAFYSAYFAGDERSQAPPGPRKRRSARPEG